MAGNATFAQQGELNASSSPDVNTSLPDPEWTAAASSRPGDPASGDVALTAAQYQVIVLIYSLPLLVVMLCSNVLLTLALYHTKDVVFRNNLILRSWILVDFVTALVLVLLVCMASATGSLYDYGYRECVVAVGFATFPIWLGHVHAVLCSYDRYVSVLHPGRYETIFSRRRMLLYLVGLWVASIFCSCIPLMFGKTFSGRNICSVLTIHRGYFVLMAILYFLVIFGALGYMYINIYMHVQRHNSQVHVTHTMTQDQLLADSRLAKIMFLNTILFASLWLPFCLVSLASLGDVTRRKSWQTALLCGYFIGSVFSACKLFVFCALSGDFRVLVVNIAKLKHRIHPVNSSGMLR